MYSKTQLIKKLKRLCTRARVAGLALKKESRRISCLFFLVCVYMCASVYTRGERRSLFFLVCIVDAPKDARAKASLRRPKVQFLKAGDLQNRRDRFGAQRVPSRARRPVCFLSCLRRGNFSRLLSISIIFLLQFFFPAF